MVKKYGIGVFEMNTKPVVMSNSVTMLFLWPTKKTNPHLEPLYKFWGR